MALYYRVNLNTTRNGVLALPPEARAAEARREAKMFLIPLDSDQPVSDTMVPDYLVTDSMAKRCMEIFPPIAAVIPEFQLIIDEIERDYVLGNLFSAVSAACVSIEGLLNIARIQLHKHHPKSKELWGKGPSNEWSENIDALKSWRYFDEDFARELNWIFKNIRCKYLHSGEMKDLHADALRSVQAAYKLLTIFLGFPEDLFRFTSGIECLNPSDPRFLEFYKPNLVSEDAQGGGVPAIAIEHRSAKQISLLWIANLVFCC